MGGIAAGSLRDFVAVERKTHDVRSSVGQAEPEYEILEERSCRIEPLGAKTMYVAQAAQSLDTARATFRWPLDVEPLVCRIRSLGPDRRVWTITSVNVSPDRDSVEVLLAEAAKEPLAAGGA